MAHYENAHIVRSLADALQYISVYHAPDFIRHLSDAYAREESSAARGAMEQILTNSRLAALGRRALCQDTGTVNVSFKVGMNANFEGDMTLQDMTDAAIRLAWSDDDNPLRASIISDPLFSRKNTGDNTPAMVTIEMVPGDKISVGLMAKGGGAENKTCFTTLNPSDDVAEWILQQIPKMGAGWCPPGMMGIGVGGSVDIAMRLAKESLYEPLNMNELLEKTSPAPEEEFRVNLYKSINDLGIGAQGLGGLTTVMDVKLKTAPTHASSLPVALIPQCAATRVVRFEITPDQGFDLAPPDADQYPIFADKASDGIRRVDLDTLTQDEKESWQMGETLLLSGSLLTGRDAAHKRMMDLLEAGEALPVSLKGRGLYYVGPVNPNANEVVGPAGPTTATRMDKFSPRLLEETGVGLMIGKAERGPEMLQVIKQHKTPYLIAVGGAAILVSRAIKASKVLAFEDLGMEAIHEFVVKDMPVVVAVDCEGRSIHQEGPKLWRRGK